MHSFSSSSYPVKRTGNYNNNNNFWSRQNNEVFENLKNQQHASSSSPTSSSSSSSVPKRNLTPGSVTSIFTRIFYAFGSRTCTLVLLCCFLAIVLFFAFQQTVVFFEHRRHRSEMIVRHGHAYLKRNNGGSGGVGSSVAEDEDGNPVARQQQGSSSSKHKKPFSFGGGNNNEAEVEEVRKKHGMQSTRLLKAKLSLEKRRERARQIRTLVILEEIRKRKSGKHSGNKTNNNNKNKNGKNNHYHNEKDEDDAFSTADLDEMIDYHHLLRQVQSDHIRIHNDATAAPPALIAADNNNNDADHNGPVVMTDAVDILTVTRELEKLFLRKLYEDPQTHKMLNLSGYSFLDPEDDELFEPLKDYEIEPLKDYDRLLAHAEQEDHKKEKFEHSIRDTVDFPLPPTAKENAAELRRLRILRDRINAQTFTLKPTLQKPPVNVKKFQFRGRRRPLHQIPKLHCESRNRVQVLPSFTRHKKHMRPKIAIVSLVAKSKKTNADNTTRRLIMHEYTFLSKLNYARKHSYDLIIEDETAVDKSRPPHWSKIRVLRKWLPFYEYVVWMDQDVMPTNYETKIEDIVEDEVNRYLLNDLKEQEKTAAKVIERAFMKRLGVETSKDNIEKVRWRYKNQIAQAATDPIRKALKKEYDDLFRGYPLNTSLGAPLDEFKMKQIDLILTHDALSGINSGVMFFRRSKWSMNLLRRMYAVPPELTKPFHDQGALRYLISPGFRGRNVEEGRIDANHVWDVPDNFFNSYPQNFIHRERDMGDEWQPGDFAVHFASCKFYPWCLDWVKHFYDLSQCNNTDSFDPPHDFLFDQARKIIVEEQEKGDLERAARALARKKRKREKDPRYGDAAQELPEDEEEDDTGFRQKRVEEKEQIILAKRALQQKERKNGTLSSSTTLPAGPTLAPLDNLFDTYKSFAPSNFLPPDDLTLIATFPPADETAWDVSRSIYPRGHRHNYFPKNFFSAEDLKEKMKEKMKQPSSQRELLAKLKEDRLEKERKEEEKEAEPERVQNRHHAHHNGRKNHEDNNNNNNNHDQHHKEEHDDNEKEHEHQENDNHNNNNHDKQQMDDNTNNEQHDRHRHHHHIDLDDDAAGNVAELLNRLHEKKTVNEDDNEDRRHYVERLAQKNMEKLDRIKHPDDHPRRVDPHDLERKLELDLAATERRYREQQDDFAHKNRQGRHHQNPFTFHHGKNKDNDDGMVVLNNNDKNGDTNDDDENNNNNEVRKMNGRDHQERINNRDTEFHDKINRRRSELMEKHHSRR